jgi:uncharacterized protein (TIGR01777 family)
MKTVLISGGTGLIGSMLIKKLKEKSYNVRLLSRTVDHQNPDLYTWDVSKMKIDENGFHDVEYVIHLAGESIVNKRWTANQKKKIIDSRVNSSNLIVNTIKKLNITPKVIVSASGVGFYGTSNDDVNFTENHPSNQDDFLSYTCRLWEKEINEANTLGVRTVNLRTGVVFSKKGGAFEVIKKPIAAGFGSPLGNGKQFVPWIHINDLVDMYIEAMENSQYTGPINAVAPSSTTNAELTKKIAIQLKRKIVLPNIPSFVLKIILGKMSQIILKGNRVSSKKVISLGFKYRYPTIDSALKQLLISKDTEP